jgi:hypothetical protein
VNWLLDGWEDILALFYGEHPDSRHPPPSHVMRILDPMFLKLPMVPTKEVAGDHDVVKESPIKTRRAVRASEDWRTGDMDLETVLRIEQMKARVLKSTSADKGSQRG